MIEREELQSRLEVAIKDMSLSDMIALADGVLIEIQHHRLAGPGWKGIRTEIQEFVRHGDVEPEPIWLCREGN